MDIPEIIKKIKESYGSDDSIYLSRCAYRLVGLQRPFDAMRFWRKAGILNAQKKLGLTPDRIVDYRKDVMEAVPELDSTVKEKSVEKIANCLNIIHFKTPSIS